MTTFQIADVDRTNTDGLSADDTRFYNVVNSMPDGVLVTDSTGAIQFANPTAESMIGLSQDQLIGTLFSFCELSEGVTEIEIPQKGSAPLMAEMRVVHVEWGGKPAMLANLRDMSQRIQITNDLQRSNKDLEEFAFVLSHDIRAPLRNINLLAGWIETDHSKNLDQDARKDINIIKVTAAQTHRMTETLLEYSRVTARQNKKPDVDLREVLQDVKSMLEEMKLKKNADITSTFLPTIDCNIAQISTLFKHVISNSMQYCLKKPQIHIDATEQDNSWTLAFNDNGVGIDERFWKKVFMPFTRLHGDSTRHGSGLGLATCKKIVEIHNGKIWLESQDGVGSTVFVQLPSKTVITSVE